MFHRILEPLVVAPLAAGMSVMAATNNVVDTPEGAIQANWIALLIGPASGLLISLVVLYFLKGYYDRSIGRDAENRNDVRDLLTRVVEIATKQQEHQTQSTKVIEENTRQTQATNQLLGQVTATLGKCHEKLNH